MNITQTIDIFRTIQGSLSSNVLLFIIILVILVLLIRFVISMFIPKASMFLFVIGLAYLLAFLYYVPTYIPRTFVINVNNTTVVDTNTIADITARHNLVLIPAFYDRLLLHMSKYNVVETDVYIPLSMLLLFLIYYSISLYSIVGKAGLVLSPIVLFITTLGMNGLFSAIITYPNILLFFIAAILIIVLVMLLLK